MLWLGQALLIVFSDTQLLAQGATPTPNENGLIRIQAAEGDTLWVIAVRAGVSLDELLDMNSLAPESLISPGQWITVGRVTPPPSSTPLPSPTSSQPLAPTPTPPAPAGEVCIAVFEDLNQNGAFEGGESFQSEVAIRINENGTVVQQYITNEESGTSCFTLPAGKYTVQRIVTHRDEITTPPRWTIEIAGGERFDIPFGAFPIAPPATPTPAPDDASSSSLAPPWVSTIALSIAGIALLIGVIFLFMPTSVTIPPPN